MIIQTGSNRENEIESKHEDQSPVLVTYQVNKTFRIGNTKYFLRPNEINSGGLKFTQKLNCKQKFSEKLGEFFNIDIDSVELPNY